MPAPGSTALVPLPPARTRRTGRRRLGTLVAAVRWSLLLSLGGLVVATATHAPGPPFALWGLPLFHVVVALAVLLTALRPALRRGDRPAWALLAAGMLSWLAGDVVWTLAVEPLGDAAPSPSPADPAYLAFYPCAAAALLLLARRQARAARRVLWLDGVVAGLGAAAVAALGLDTTAGTGDGPPALVELAYPVADLVLLALTVGVLAAQGWRLSPLWWYLGAGCLALVLVDTAYLVMVAAGVYAKGSPWDVGWPLAFTLLALAAWAPAGRRAVVDEPPALVVPNVVAAVSVGVLVSSVTLRVPVLAVALAAAALIGAAVRTALAVRELRALVESRRLSRTDELTGLGNRRLLQQRLDDLLAARAPGDSLAVLLLDLDRFKEVNDALGHQVGDALLRRVGPRLAAVLRDDDVVTRLGGDEFALVLGPGADAPHARRVAARVRDALRAPFVLDGVALHVDASVGIALCPEHASTTTALLQRADVAMYEAKRARTGFALYDGAADRHDRDRLETIAQLHAAVDGEQLVCHYQPQCDLATGRVVGVEALVRWEHPDRGLLAPEAFLGLAGQVGLMALVTRRVLRRALADCRQWRADGALLDVSVNLSALALGDVDLPVEIARLLRENDLPGNALVLEVTEDVMLLHGAQAADVVAQLQVLGVRLAIDDYGTGYSSLTQLRTLPVRELKLDRSYIAGLGSDRRDAAIVRSTVALAHALDLTVVAEGVETADDWQELARLQCDRAQGYVLSPPLPPAGLLPWLARHADASDRTR